MRFVLIGNYGVGNLGDEALCQYFLEAFPEVTWTVVTADPTKQGEVPRLPLGFRSFFRPWWQTIIALAVSDGVVFGGGSLFTDSESVFACLLWWWHGFIARVIGVPVLLAAQGVGPFHTRLGLRLARATFESAVFLSVRDEESLGRVNKWNVRVPPILTFDPVYSFFSRTTQRPQAKKILVVIPRGNSNDRFFAALGSSLRQHVDEVRILLLQPSKTESILAEKMKTEIVRATPCETILITSIAQLLAEIAGASEVLSQRYHGALAALAVGVPITIVPQVAGDKLDGLIVLQQNPAKLAELQSLVKQGEEGLRKALVA